jgi:hypothetical protein
VGRLDLENPPSLPELDKVYPKWVEYLTIGGGPKTIIGDRIRCELCPYDIQNQTRDTKYNFVSWKDCVSFQWNHMCDKHGCLGANTAFDKVPEWIESYICQIDNKSADALIFDTLFKAGFSEYGVWTQGEWKSFPKNGF